jgi:hypothetical protein
LARIGRIDYGKKNLQYLNVPVKIKKYLFVFIRRVYTHERYIC